eukprot:218830-Prorocentrum_minimum.AAC.5
MTLPPVLVNIAEPSLGRCGWGDKGSLLPSKSGDLRLGIERGLHFAFFSVVRWGVEVRTLSGDPQFGEIRPTMLALEHGGFLDTLFYGKVMRSRRRFYGSGQWLVLIPILNDACAHVG